MVIGSERGGSLEKRYCNLEEEKLTMMLFLKKKGTAKSCLVIFLRICVFNGVLKYG